MEDARGAGGRGGGMAGGGLGLLTMLLRAFGVKGVLVAVVLGFVFWKVSGINPLTLLGGSVSVGPASREQVEATPEETERFEFVRAVLAETEDVWRNEFARIGGRYVEPRLVVYRRSVQSGCGIGSAAMGPFYCPADQKIYIDLSFYDELKRTFNAPGDLAQAYVVAHEVGHHVQKLLGASDKVAARRGQPDYNEQSVRLELQADFYAGLWARHSLKTLKLTKQDIEDAMRAANAIGDDAIQKKQQGRVVPHTFTHGTSEQRMRWFMKGLESGKIEDGDTFSMSYSQL